MRIQRKELAEAGGAIRPRTSQTQGEGGRKGGFCGSLRQPALVSKVWRGCGKASSQSPVRRTLGLPGVRRPFSPSCGQPVQEQPWEARPGGRHGPGLQRMAAGDPGQFRVLQQDLWEVHRGHTFRSFTTVLASRLQPETTAVSLTIWSCWMFPHTQRTLPLPQRVSCWFFLPGMPSRSSRMSFRCYLSTFPTHVLLHCYQLPWLGLGVTVNHTLPR